MKIPVLGQRAGIVAALSLAGNSAFAGLSVSLNGTFPSQAAVIAATPQQAGFSETTEWVTLEQTFKVLNAFQMDKFFIEYSAAVMGQTFGLELFPVADVNATAIAGGATLFPSGVLSFTFPSSLTGDRIMELDLTGADQITLAESLETSGYAIRFRDLTPDTTLAFGWRRTTFQTYPDGSSYRNGASNGTGDTGRDFSLAILAVPEPGTATLLLGGLALLGSSRIARRRGKR